MKTMLHVWGVTVAQKYKLDTTDKILDATPKFPDTPDKILNATR